MKSNSYHTRRKSITFLITALIVVAMVLSSGIGAVAAPTVIATPTVGTNPWAAGVNPNTNKIYMTDFSGGDVSVIDGATNSVSTISAVGVNPCAVAVNPNTNRIYVADNSGSQHKVSVINGATDTVLTDIDLVSANCAGIGVNPNTNRVYVTNATGTGGVIVINGDDNSVITTIGAGTYWGDVGVNPDTNRIYVSNGTGNSVSVINGASNSILTTITGITNPTGIGVNPNTNRIYVASFSDYLLYVIDGETNTVLTNIAVGVNPIGVGINPATNRIYATNETDDNVSVINGATNTVMTTVTVGDDPYQTGVNPLTNRVYVPNRLAGTVSVISDPNEVPAITSISPDSAATGGPPFTLTVNGTNFLPVSKVRWNGVDLETTYVSDTRLRAAVPAVNISNTRDCEVTVFNPAPGGGTSSIFDFALRASTWYLAEGTTAWGFSCYITIENPNDGEVKADITYMTDNGAIPGGTITLPGVSQTTVNPVDKLGQKDFSTMVKTQGGQTIAVDRTMTWTGTGAGASGELAGKAAASPEAHCSVGVNGPSRTWYLPEGSSAWGFECWLLIQNPNNSEAICTVTYMIEGAAPVVLQKPVPANSRKTYNMVEDIGSHDASIKVESNLPVIPERAMYRNSRREGHDSIGTIAPAMDYYLAEGCTGYASNFVTWVLVQNPQNATNHVTVTYLTGSGEVAGPVIDMPANSRKTIRVNDGVPTNSDVSTKVHGSLPIIAERAMYWDNGLGEACHDSIGMDAAHTVFYLPDGQTSEGRETWTLVSNPNNAAVTVEISYLIAGGGTRPVTFTDNIPANSRKTYNMADKGINGRASIRVVSPMNPVMVERAMYWNNRGAGTDTIGGYAD